MKQDQLINFKRTVLKYYQLHGRHDLPWRQTTDSYHILVSELMLQQTQVGRVTPKFKAFLQAFPTVESLAHASLADVLTVWLGLGYNRRARFLHLAAQKITHDFNGVVPNDRRSLESLPGIGPNTAGAILAYAFNQPELFIETNIRTVYIHHFFKSGSNVDDREIMALLEETTDRNEPRQWYWALMDYGTHLKTAGSNNISRSRHYTKQTVFKGSLRQLRGAVLRELQHEARSLTELQATLADDRLRTVLDALVKEGFLEASATGKFCLTGFRELP